MKKPSPFTPDKDLLRAEYGKFWKLRKSMIEHGVSQCAATAVLFTGEIIPVDKQHIITHFCFGESGSDYEDAGRMAQHARTSEDYFLQENMAHFNRWTEMLEAAVNGECYVGIATMYWHQPEDCRLRNAIKIDLRNILEACGGSCRIEDLPGKTVTLGTTAYRIATPQELRVILEAWRYAGAAHEKKVRAYLKRYGTSKVRSWTYWRDA